MLRNINMMLKKARKEESGFTLIELIVVVVILGILAAVVIPRIVGQTDDAQTAADRSDIQIIQTAIDRYIADNQTDNIDANDATAFGNLITGKYLRTTTKYADAAAYAGAFTIDDTTSTVTAK